MTSKINNRSKKNTYIALTRISKPTGIFLLWIPCVWGIAAQRFSFFYFLMEALLFLIGAISLRTVGCILNDIFDKDFDKHVERTKNRPLANNDLSKKEALIFALFSLIPGGFVFFTLPFLSKIIALLGLFMAIIYPLFKRFTSFPQLFLGLTFNIGVIITGINFIPPLPLFLLYCAGIFWTLAYDTIYAFQDIKDDLLIGVKSTAVFFKATPKLSVSIFYTVMLIFLIIFMILMNKRIDIGYILFTMLTVSITYEVKNWHPNNIESCHHFFKRNIGIGLLILGCCLFSSVQK